MTELLVCPQRLRREKERERERERERKKKRKRELSYSTHRREEKCRKKARN